MCSESGAQSRRAGAALVPWGLGLAHGSGPGLRTGPASFIWPSGPKG